MGCFLSCQKTFHLLSHESSNPGSNGQSAVTVLSLCILTKGFQGVMNLELNFDFKVSPQDL